PSHPHLHSFPTRRSSDLQGILEPAFDDLDVLGSRARACEHLSHHLFLAEALTDPGLGQLTIFRPRLWQSFKGIEQPHLAAIAGRSEEHTSELQSLTYLVC